MQWCLHGISSPPIFSGLWKRSHILNQHVSVQAFWAIKGHVIANDISFDRKVLVPLGEPGEVIFNLCIWPNTNYYEPDSVKQCCMNVWLVMWLFKCLRWDTLQHFPEFDIIQSVTNSLPAGEHINSVLLRSCWSLSRMGWCRSGFLFAWSVSEL